MSCTYRRSVTLSLCLLVIVACSSHITARAAQQAAPARQAAPAKEAKLEYPPPGELIDVGGFKLHCVVKGEGPVVVCDACWGEASYDWAAMQDALAEFATVVCFDRAGLGWSEPGPLPRTNEKTVEELRVLLKKRNLQPPYMLVGNSYGGINARLYASLYPEEVAGLVLVDAGYLDDLPEDFPVDTRFIGGGMLGKASPDQVLAIAAQMDLRPIFERRFVKRGQSTEEDFQLRVTMKARYCEVEAMMAEKKGLAHLRETFGKMRHVGDKPVTVLSSIRFNNVIKWWLESQEKLAKNISDDVVWIKVDCGHRIHHEKPEVVADAVKKTLERVRKKSGQPTAK